MQYARKLFPNADDYMLAQAFNGIGYRLDARYNAKNDPRYGRVAVKTAQHMEQGVRMTEELLKKGINENEIYNALPKHHKENTLLYLEILNSKLYDLLKARWLN
jgi:hypothetical protein